MQYIAVEYRSNEQIVQKLAQKNKAEEWISELRANLQKFTRRE